MPNTIILVDLKDWSIAFEHPSKTTTECCHVCSVAEDITRTKKEIEATKL